MPRPDPSPIAVPTALLLGAMGFALIGALLAAPDISTRGEAREATVVRTIVREHTWVLPRREGRIPSKPPFFHWLAAASAHLFGLSDTTVRLSSVLAAMVVAATTIVIGSLLDDPWTGWLAACVLFGVTGWWTSALEARVDMVFAACVTLSMGGFAGWRRRGSDGARALCWFAMAAAILTKGPAGAVLPLLVIIGVLALERDLGALRRLCATPSLLAAAIVVAGWYALAYRDGGSAFVATQVHHENLDRFLGHGAFHARRTHRPLKLEGAFLTLLLPWNLVLVAALRRRLAGIRPGANERFLHVWWATVLVFFTVAAGKRSVYLLPLYPAVALLAARELLAWVPAGRRAPLVGVVVLFDMAIAVATFSLQSKAHAATDALVRFARAVRTHVPAQTTLVVTGAVRENDRIVVGYLLDRSLPRVGGDTPVSGYRMAPASAAGLAGCTRVSLASESGGRLALLHCP